MRSCRGSITHLSGKVVQLGRHLRRRVRTGWHDPFEANLAIAGNGDVTVTAGDGRQLFFVKQTDGTFRPYAGGRATLTKLASTYERSHMG